MASICGDFGPRGHDGVLVSLGLTKVSSIRCFPTNIAIQFSFADLNKPINASVYFGGGNADEGGQEPCHNSGYRSEPPFSTIWNE